MHHSYVSLGFNHLNVLWQNYQALAESSWSVAMMPAYKWSIMLYLYHIRLAIRASSLLLKPSLWEYGHSLCRVYTFSKAFKLAWPSTPFGLSSQLLATHPCRITQPDLSSTWKEFTHMWGTIQPFFYSSSLTYFFLLWLTLYTQPWLRVHKDTWIKIKEIIRYLRL